MPPWKPPKSTVWHVSANIDFSHIAIVVSILILTQTFFPPRLTKMTTAVEEFEMRDRNKLAGVSVRLSSNAGYSESAKEAPTAASGTVYGGDVDNQARIRVSPLDMLA